MGPVLIVGAGAIGSYFALRLHAAGHDVRLLARGKRLEQVCDAGILFEDANGIACAHVPAQEDWSELGHARFIVLCTKAWAVAEALEAIAPCVGPGSVIVTVQNGVETPSQVARRFPDSAVVAGRMHGFFEMTVDRVRHVGVVPSLSFGALAVRDRAAADELYGLLADAGIAGNISTDILAELWEKLVLSSAFGGMGAATGLAVGAMREDAQVWALLVAALREVEMLGRARGIMLPPDCADRALGFIAEFPPDATTSMKRDLEAGLGSEYDYLTGAVVRMANESGLALPAHRQIEKAIRARGLLGATAR